MSAETAWARLAEGNLEDALKHGLAALEEAPNDSEPSVVLGYIAFKAGDRPEAKVRLTRALDLDPLEFRALALMARIAMDEREYETALGFAQTATGVQPADPNILQTLAQCYLLLGRPFEALEACERAVELAPNAASCYRGLASAYGAFGSTYDRLINTWRAYELDRRGIDLERLMLLEHGMGRLDRLAQVAEAVLARNPTDRKACLFGCRAVTALGGDVDASIFWKTVSEKLDLAWLGDREIGQSLAELGDFDRARTRLLRSIEQHPRQGFAYNSLFSARKPEPEDEPLIERMEGYLLEPDFNIAERRALEFALGHVCDARDEVERAAKHFENANAIGASVFYKDSFDARQLNRQVSQHLRLFESPAPAARGAALDRPIFVVGPMRSGTTLVEQILASHPLVAGAGELDFWNGSEGILVDQENGVLREHRIPERRDTYLRLLNEVGQGKARVVDKFPGNLKFAGLLNRIFPGAPIISMRRDPFDVACSLWTLDVEAPHAHRKEDIAAMGRQAIALNEFWKTKLPPERFLEVRYEELVAEPEVWIRRILKHCGLPWNDACLRANENSRRVRTVSHWQVRQPIYSSSTTRWKRYEPYLPEFVRLGTIAKPRG